MNYFQAIRILQPAAAFQMKDPTDYKTILWDEMSNREYDEQGKPIPGTELAIPSKEDCEAISTQVAAEILAEDKDITAKKLIDRKLRRAVVDLVMFAGGMPSAPQRLKDLREELLPIINDIKGED